MSFSRQVKTALRSLQEKGISRTLLAATSQGLDLYFDRRHKTDTCSFVEVSSLGLEGVDNRRVERYQPTHAAPLRGLFRALPIQPDGVFVDLGCGKGRVLLVASEFGFKEARGVELSPRLCDIARSNCATWKSSTGTATDFAVIQADVLDYEIRDDEDLFYLYNPFDAHTLRAFSRKLLDSLDRRRRTIRIVYRHAAHRQVIEREMHPTDVSDLTFWGFDFAIFEIDGGSRPKPASLEPR